MLVSLVTVAVQYSISELNVALSIVVNETMISVFSIKSLIDLSGPIMWPVNIILW